MKTMRKLTILLAFLPLLAFAAAGARVKTGEEYRVAKASAIDFLKSQSSIKRLEKNDILRIYYIKNNKRLRKILACHVCRSNEEMEGIARFVLPRFEEYVDRGFLTRKNQ